MQDGGGKDDDLCRYVVLLCVWVWVCVLACVCSCAHAHVRKCRWFVRYWFLSFSVFLCLLVCVLGGGGGCMDRCVGEGVFVRECLRVCDCILLFLVA